MDVTLAPFACRPRRSEAPLDLVGPIPGERDDLVPSAVPRNDLDVAPRYVECLREQPHDRVVRPPVLRRRGDADLPAAPCLPTTAPRRSGRDAERQLGRAFHARSLRLPLFDPVPARNLAQLPLRRLRLGERSSWAARRSYAPVASRFGQLAGRSGAAAASSIIPSAARSSASMRRASALQPLALDLRVARDRACLAVRLGEDHLRLALRLLLHLRRGLLGGDERLRQRLFARPQLLELLLDRLDAGRRARARSRQTVSKLSAISSSSFSTASRLYPSRRPPDADVSQLNGCVGHVTTS